jgi:hypothetical protein
MTSPSRSRRTGFLSTLLLVFAGIAVFVGAFIFNVLDHGRPAHEGVRVCGPLAPHAPGPAGGDVQALSGRFIGLAGLAAARDQRCSGLQATCRRRARARAAHGVVALLWGRSRLSSPRPARRATLVPPLAAMRSLPGTPDAAIRLSWVC